MNDEVNPADLARPSTVIGVKVADLPAKWRGNPLPKRSTERSRGYAIAELACADELEAALARQEADKTAASVITLTDAPTAPPAAQADHFPDATKKGAAQAVDLGQFRDCVIEAKESWLQCAENWKGRVRESQYREWVDDCDRLLKLIDQQAGKENING